MEKAYQQLMNGLARDAKQFKLRALSVTLCDRHPIIGVGVVSVGIGQCRCRKTQLNTTNVPSNQVASVAFFGIGRN